MDTSFLPVLLLFAGLVILIILSVIDLKTRLLPNVWVAPFAVLGIIFHIVTEFEVITPMQMILGGAVGYGFLYFLRMAANAYYKQDSLGLGDVKLMGAAGLWLGPEGVLFALTAGAFAGLFHGIGYAAWLALKTKTKMSIKRLAIPAGPGFAAGIVIAGCWLLKDFF